MGISSYSVFVVGAVLPFLRSTRAYECRVVTRESTTNFGENLIPGSAIEVSEGFLSINDPHMSGTMPTSCFALSIGAVRTEW